MKITQRDLQRTNALEGSKEQSNEDGDERENK